MNGQEMNNKSRLTLEKRHQLIDLNKEYVNFDITFECRSVDATRDFEVVVVNQEQLNTIDLTSLTMKLTKNGYISGNIIADEDRYQNYFLILRAPEEPLEVDLEIRIRPIDPKTDVPPPQQPTPPPLADHPPYAGDPLLPCQTSASASSLPTTHLVLIVVGLLIIGGAVGYYFLTKNNNHQNNKHTDFDECGSVASHKSSDASSEYGGQLLSQLVEKN